MEQGDPAHGRHDLDGRLFKVLYGCVLQPNLRDPVLSLANAEQLVQVLLVGLVFGVGRGGKVGVDSHAAVIHRNRRTQPGGVALGLQ